MHVLEKSAKLEMIYDRIQTIDCRFKVLERDPEIRFLKGEATHSESQRDLEQLDSDRAFLRDANIGSESMPG